MSEGAAIGILHPGQMGVSVAASARAAGSHVLWASDGRSEATARRAAEAGLGEVHNLVELVSRCQLVISVCPPHAALDVARRCAEAGFDGVFVDGNAVSPATAREIARVIEDGGAAFVDGGIIGPPAWRHGSTRLYLSGDRAVEVAATLGGGVLEIIALEGGSGAASALKMTYAAFTKGSAALLAAILAVAEREGVRGALVDEWNRAGPDVAMRREAQVRNSAARAWRFAGEMREIAAIFEAAGLPPGFHLAAAEVFERLDGYKDAADAPAIEELLAALLPRESR